MNSWGKGEKQQVNSKERTYKWSPSNHYRSWVKGNDAEERAENLYVGLSDATALIFLAAGR